MSQHEDWDVTIWVRVHDKERLLAAARAHPDAAGMPTEDFYLDDGEIDVGACLTMLLDPGMIENAGVKIQDSGAEAAPDAYDVDFGDERN